MLCAVFRTFKVVLDLYRFNFKLFEHTLCCLEIFKSYPDDGLGTLALASALTPLHQRYRICLVDKEQLSTLEYVFRLLVIK